MPRAFVFGWSIADGLVNKAFFCKKVTQVDPFVYNAPFTTARDDG